MGGPWLRFSVWPRRARSLVTCPPQQLLLLGWKEAQAVGPHLTLGVTPLSGWGLWRWVARLHVVGWGHMNWGCADRCPGNGEHLHLHPRLPLPDGLPGSTTSQAPPYGHGRGVSGYSSDRAFQPRSPNK